MFIDQLSGLEEQAQEHCGGEDGRRGQGVGRGEREERRPQGDPRWRHEGGQQNPKAVVSEKKAEK